IEQAAGFLEASDDGGDGRQPVSAVVFVDDGRHGSPHSCVAGWWGCRAARNAAASDALDAAVKIAFLSAFKTASQDARYCAGSVRGAAVIRKSVQRKAAPRSAVSS